MTTTDIEKLEEKLHALVVAARRGDDASYKAFLRALLPFLRRNVLAQAGRYGHAQLGEDVTQEVLLAVHLKLHTYDASQPFLAWLRAVMRHKVIDALRRLRADTVSIDADDGFELAAAGTAEEGVIVRDLKGLLARLRPPAGDIIYDLRVEGASVRDIAAKYGMTESNVKVTVHRGMQKLARLAQEEGGKA